MTSYGMRLGVAFQLIDDVLDYSGDLHETGKNLGDDLAEGKPTLPLIHAMRHGTPEHARLIRAAIEQALTDESLRHGATKVQQSFAESGGPPEAATLLESLID